jgi:hypothetical protein
MAELAATRDPPRLVAGKLSDWRAKGNPGQFDHLSDDELREMVAGRMEILATKPEDFH